MNTVTVISHFENDDEAERKKKFNEIFFNMIKKSLENYISVSQKKFEKNKRKAVIRESIRLRYRKKKRICKTGNIM